MMGTYPSSPSLLSLLSAALWQVEHFTLWRSLLLYSCHVFIPAFTVSAYQPRGHQQSPLSTVCFIKSLNSPTLRPSASCWQGASAVELSGASESWVSLADVAHGWLELLTVPNTDSTAICLQNPWAHRLCVCMRVWVSAFNSSQLTSSFKSFLCEDVELF